MLISFFLWVIAIFAALIVMMLVKPKLTRTTILFSGIFTVICGSFFYGYGYVYTAESGALAAIKTVFSVIRIFFGGNAYDDISAAPIFSYTSVQFVFWLLHFTGTFSTAAAALSTFGKSAFRRLRLKFRTKEELCVVYGIRSETVEFAKKLAEHTGGNVVLVGVNPDHLSEDSLQDPSCHIRSDAAALEGKVSFLRSIGMDKSKRKLHLFCLSEDLFDCRIYAENILASLETLQVNSEQTALTLQSSQQLTDAPLLANSERYGFGSVDFLDVPELVSRMLMLRFPPYRQLSFDENGKAKENLNCAIVGFGEVGQSVLRSLVMNGQFEGSTFRCDVFDPNYTKRLGKLKVLSPELLRQYEILFHDSDGRGDVFYDHLMQKGRDLKYIVLCTGSEKLNSLIARELLPCLDRLEIRAKVCLCDRNSVSAIDQTSVEKFSLYDPAILKTDALDQRAMALNYSYCGNTARTPSEEWQHCDYFSRLSSRASADFAEAMAYAAGLDPEAFPENWKPEEALLENLAKTEHLRWCAFHYAMGFTAMSFEEFDQRCKQFVEEQNTTGKGKIRVGKDLKTRRHICLVSWDMLDALSEKELQATGRAVNYKQLDRNNVLALPTLLKTKKG